MQKSLVRRAAAGIAGAAGVVSVALMPFAASALTALENLNSSAGETGNAIFGPGSGTQSLPTLIGRFISAALGLLGVVLVVLIVYAGFLWMTAQGEADKVKKAKGIITNAVIGMVIIFAAYAITNFVISSLTKSLAA